MDIGILGRETGHGPQGHLGSDAGDVTQGDAEDHAAAEF